MTAVAYPSKNGSPAAGFCTAEVAAPLLDFQKRSIGLYKGLYFDTDDENDLMAFFFARLEVEFSWDVL